MKGWIYLMMAHRQRNNMQWWLFLFFGKTIKYVIDLNVVGSGGSKDKAKMTILHLLKKSNILKKIIEEEVNYY